FIYMVDRVNSDTELVISQPATFTVKNTSYSINLTEPNSYSDANNRMTAIASDTTYFLRAMDQWMMNNGVVTVELSNGQKVTLDSIKKMQGDISNKADLTLSKTQSFTSAIEATTKLTSKSADGKTSISLTTSNAGGTNIELNSASGYNGIQIPKKTGTLLVAEPQYITHKSINDWAGIRLYKANGEYGYIETNTRNNEIFTLGYRNSSDVNQAVLAVPRKNGTLLVDGDYGMNTSGNIEVADFNNLKGFGWHNQPATVDAGKSLNHPTKRAGNLTVWRGAGQSSCIQHWMDYYTAEALSRTYYSYEDKWSRWYKTYGEQNTTVDPQGFIKKASPIVNINPDGTFTTNDESEGATVTRVAQGEYLIEGVLGFNSDAGWGGVDGGIEIPLDVNKQPLIWVGSEVMGDGSILVKTYHRTHPNAPEFANNKIDGFSDGDPIDIPDGRFISVRVQMPEQSIYNVRMHEMEEVQKAEEERRQKEEEMKAQFGLGENEILL
ncbi:pyocin knob domain-containing protein, partial [Proteus mirabilis]